MVEIINSNGRGKLLHVDGYLYYKHSENKGRFYWCCRKKCECSARAITSNSGQNIIIHKGPQSSIHNHAPNLEEVYALKVMTDIKRKASEHPEAPPAQILRTELQQVPAGILAELPERQNIRKAITRQRVNNMPSNPRSMNELHELPNQFKQTIAGDQFLLYDSFEDIDYQLTCGRIIIFATKENLRILMNSPTWFVDGTFKVVPTIFFQLFTILGPTTQTTNGTDQVIGLPLVYALLESKEEAAYSKVYEIILSEAQKFGINIVKPQFVMTDFEQSIINATMKIIEVEIHTCLFHLCQSLYRRIQAEGLQSQYNDPENRNIKITAQMTGALAFVPPEKVVETFDFFLEQVPDEYMPIAEYFEVNYFLI